ncbi:uncharacterized protein BJ171DRAFT_204493 [Polychytrium aggregatum]|uniref:uncharacterized protein n=1 Tax=Polychytrium aggregatum TaxID=110093 RepID=UPI0022FE4CCA|nr:uncharacterized protein BJ171DRAFT_204493 [Polychytrium aggregatum]KAI9199582.1 hypothetical protein BJ171DRAFT_204493 [Polychytrium aggregatum]
MVFKRHILHDGDDVVTLKRIKAHPHFSVASSAIPNMPAYGGDVMMDCSSALPQQSVYDRPIIKPRGSRTPSIHNTYEALTALIVSYRARLSELCQFIQLCEHDQASTGGRSIQLSQLDECEAAIARLLKDLVLFSRRTSQVSSSYEYIISHEIQTLRKQTHETFLRLCWLCRDASPTPNHIHPCLQENGVSVEEFLQSHWQHQEIHSH